MAPDIHMNSHNRNHKQRQRTQVRTVVWFLHQPAHQQTTCHERHPTFSFSWSLAISWVMLDTFSCSFFRSSPKPLQRSSSLGTKPSALPSLPSRSSRAASATDSLAAAASRSCCSFLVLLLPCSSCCACRDSRWCCCLQAALRDSNWVKARRRRLRVALR